MMHFVKKSMHAGMLAIVLTILLLSARVAQAAPLTCGAWSVVASPNGGDLRGVSAVSMNDVWTVGTVHSIHGIRTLTEHWDGTSWSVVKSPNVGPSSDNYLVKVVAISANDAWAVGTYGLFTQNFHSLIEHWNGKSWNMVSSPQPGYQQELAGVAATSANDVWAVGFFVPVGKGPQTLIEHWDGSRWSVVASPNSEPIAYFANAVVAISANDVWMVGWADSSPPQALIEHWDGTSWSVVPSPSPDTSSNFLNDLAAVSANDIWAVGTTQNTGEVAPRTLTEHWDGSSWSVVASPNSGRYTVLNAVTAVSVSNVWAVGLYYDDGTLDHTLIEHWDGASWSIVPSPSPGIFRNSLNAVTAVSANNIWAVGSDRRKHGQTLTEFYC